MRIPRIKNILACVFVAIGVTATAVASDPASLFLEAYQEYTNAEQLEINGSYEQSLSKYRYCVSLLEQIQKNHPEYSPIVIEYRLGKSRESVARVSSSPSAPVPMPATSGGDLEGPLPSRDPLAAPPTQLNRPAPPPATRPQARPPSISYRIPIRPTQSRVPQTPIESPPQAPSSPDGVSVGAYRVMEQELAFTKLQLANAQAQVAALDQRILETTARERSALHETDRTKVEVVELKSRNAQMRQALADATAAAQAAESGLTTSSGEIEKLKSELVEAKANLEVANEANTELYAKLDTAAEYITASDKIREQLDAERRDLVEQIRTGRDEQANQLAAQKKELEAELETLRESLATAVKESENVETLEAANADLTAKLATAEEKVTKLAALDPEREKLIEDLRAELADAETAVAAANESVAVANESATASTEALAQLEKQLEETSRVAAVTTGAVAEENALLRDIISRQLEGSAKRADARERLVSEVEKLKLRSPDLDAIIASLTAPEIELTPDEKKLFTWRTQAPQGVSGDGPANFSIVVPKRDEVSSTGDEVLSDTAAELVTKARSLIDDGKPDEALEVYRELCQNEPENFFAQFNFAVVCHLTGNYEEAEQAFVRALELRPGDDEVLTNLGAVRFRLGNVDGARSALADAIEADPDNPRAHYFLGLSYSEEGNTDAAMLQLRRSLELEPDQPEAHLNLALLLATTKPPSIDAAREHYEKATALGAAPNASIEALLP